MHPQKIFCSVFLLAILLSGCALRQAALLEDASLIGTPKLASQEAKSGYAINVPVCNRGKDELKAEVEVQGDSQEIIGGALSGFDAGAGAYMQFTLCRIKEKRLKPIFIKIKWKRGQEQGLEKFVIAPGQDNIL